MKRFSLLSPNGVIPEKELICIGSFYHSDYRDHHRSGAQEAGGNPPPPKRDKLLKKNDGISEGYIFSNNFPTIRCNINFAIVLLSKIFKNLSKFSNNLSGPFKRRKNA